MPRQKGRLTLLELIGSVDQHVCNSLHVFPHGRAVFVGELFFIDGGHGVAHEFQPAVAGGRVDAELGVAHPQARVATPGVELRRAAPVLHQEPAQSIFGALEVLFRVHRPEDIVGADLAIELVHDSAEGLLTNSVVEARSHASNHICSAIAGGAGWARPRPQGRSTTCRMGAAGRLLSRSVEHAGGLGTRHPVAPLGEHAAQTTRGVLGLDEVGDGGIRGVAVIPGGVDALQGA